MSNVVSIPNIWNSSVGSYFAFWLVIFCTAKNLVLITKTNMYGTCGEELYAERSSSLSKLQCNHVCFGVFLQEIVVSNFMNNRSFVEMSLQHSTGNKRGGIILALAKTPILARASALSVFTRTIHVNFEIQRLIFQ